MYEKWTSKETHSLNLITDSQQHYDLYLSQQVLEPYTQTSSSAGT